MGQYAIIMEMVDDDAPKALTDFLVNYFILCNNVLLIIDDGNITMMMTYQPGCPLARSASALARR